jgi:hypothetical protein
MWDELKSKLDVRRLVFLDETWTKTNMTRLYGRAPRGERVIGRVPHGHWQTTTFLAGLRHDRIVAPLVLDGPIDGTTFRAWVEQCLAPTLDPDDIVVADNLPSHKVAGVHEAIEASRGQYDVPAVVFPGPQSDRAAVRQAQSGDPTSGPAFTRSAVRGDRLRTPSGQLGRMRQLPGPRRIRTVSLKML